MNVFSRHNCVKSWSVINKQPPHVFVMLVQVGGGNVHRSIGAVWELQGATGIRKGGADVRSA